MSITYIGLVAAALTSFAGLPQLIKIIRMRETRDISLEMYIMLAAGVSLWLIYGTFQSDLPLIIGNIVALTINLGILILKIKYK